MQPPFLVIRPGVSFWVETDPPYDCTATLQAFEDGCFSETLWYDTKGGEWTVVDAKLKSRPSHLDRAMPWRRVAVALRFGPRAEADVGKVLSRIRQVLDTDNEFCEYLKAPVTDVWAQLSKARTAADLIALARRHA